MILLLSNSDIAGLIIWGAVFILPFMILLVKSILNKIYCSEKLSNRIYALSLKKQQILEIAIISCILVLVSGIDFGIAYCGCQAFDIMDSLWPVFFVVNWFVACIIGYTAMLTNIEDWFWGNCVFDLGIACFVFGGISALIFLFKPVYWIWYYLGGFLCVEAETWWEKIVYFFISILGIGWLVATIMYVIKR